MAGGGTALFDTAVGRCGVAWGADGLVAVALPAGTDAATLALLRRDVVAASPGTGPADASCDGASGDGAAGAAGGPPAEVAEAIARMIGLLDGVPDDLADVRVDLTGVPAFHRRVYEVARAIPPGRTLTYGEVAAQLGIPGAAQAVGRALGRNPVPIVVPCHRVLAAGGAMGGFSAPGGIGTKRRMLVIEGAMTPAPPTLF
ncbi:Methylated-DNA/protein-cysteine methyltransferase [Frankia canadensis]|uniref:methylated-DNA--[protein]-cysteine S-methyltransferase n=1 Tax=Frankia canadensis TaxID=1836972 RepID=A0A2I2KUX4_9ACTN|nr:MGMT family protein [Frankia canadensis]SNQ49469.1 Methylated-DNA/protein-cysteine methyltransferase [Frankia canadensis]SOU56759.1 Methylated-DNA/protein-cysteine methyltransferase [Frankia canadensis]